MKKRGMAWTSEGAHHMAKAIQMCANGLLNSQLRTKPAYIRTEPSRKVLDRVKESFNEDPGAWLAARMPALTGPHQSRPWVKALRNIGYLASVGTQS